MRLQHIRRGLRLAASVLAVASVSTPALAWEPEKSVEIVVAAGAGGASDQMARMLQASRRTPRRAWPFLPSSKAFTISGAGIPRSDTSRPRRSSKGLSIPAHTILPPCSRPSRNGLETPSQAAPTACRPSLTAAARAGQRNVQAGMKRGSRPNQKRPPKRRTKCRQTSYHNKRNQLSTKPGQVQ